MRKVYFRADIGNTIGMGHFFRSLALAEYLKGEFYTIFFIPKDYNYLHSLVADIVSEIIELPKLLDLEEEAFLLSNIFHKDAIVVLDGYNFNTQYQQIFKREITTLVCIDDIHAFPFLADCIINTQPNLDYSVYDIQPYTTIFSGLQYALLRSAFNQSTFKKVREIEKIESILINMGGADPYDLSLKVLKVAVLLSGLKTIHVVVGKLYNFHESLNEIISQFPNIKKHQNLSSQEFAELIGNCEIAVLPASTVVIEACSVGIGLISGITAENQKDNLKGLTKEQVLLNVGDLRVISDEILFKKINSLIQSPDLINEQISNQRKLIDGKASERYISLFKSFK